MKLFDPTFCKVLVRYNPQGDRALNKRQAARLKRLSDFLADKNRSRFMFELLVPPEKAQLDKLKGDKKVYDLEVRPRLMVEAIRELQDAGVEPDLWKIEGLDRREDCEEIVTAARAAGRDRVGCIVLGRGEDDRKVRNWLETVAASVPGFIGFAIGRTTFWDPLVAWRSKKATREQAVAEIAGRYREFVDLFERADLASLLLASGQRPTGTSILYGGLSHATRNDRPRPDGSQYGAPPVEGRPSMRGVRSIGTGGGGAGEGKGHRREIAGGVRQDSSQSHAPSG